MPNQINSYIPRSPLQLSIFSKFPLISISSNYKKKKKRGSVNVTTKNETSSKINPFQQRREHNNIIK